MQDIENFILAIQFRREKDLDALKTLRQTVNDCTRSDIDDNTELSRLY